MSDKEKFISDLRQKYDGITFIEALDYINSCAIKLANLDDLFIIGDRVYYKYTPNGIVLVNSKYEFYEYQFRAVKESGVLLG